MGGVALQSYIFVCEDTIFSVRFIVFTVIEKENKNKVIVQYIFL